MVAIPAALSWQVAGLDTVLADESGSSVPGQKGAWGSPIPAPDDSIEESDASRSGGSATPAQREDARRAYRAQTAADALNTLRRCGIVRTIPGKDRPDLEN